MNIDYFWNNIKEVTILSYLDYMVHTKTVIPSTSHGRWWLSCLLLCYVPLEDVIPTDISMEAVVLVLLSKIYLLRNIITKGEILLAVPNNNYHALLRKL